MFSWACCCFGEWRQIDPADLSRDVKLLILHFGQNRKFSFFHEKTKRTIFLSSQILSGWISYQSSDKLFNFRNDRRFEKKFFYYKRHGFWLTNHQLKKTPEDSRYRWRFSRSKITTKVLDSMALVFRFPTYHPTW